MSNEHFTSRALPISCRGEQLLLHPQRVMYWPAGKTLFAADVHAGKEHVLARSGIAIPQGASEQTLLRLFTLCDDSQASSLVILGDFVHATPHTDESWLSVLSQLLDQRPELNVSIIAGNHDTRQSRDRIDPRIRWHAGAESLGPFVLQHEPGNDVRGYLLAGHLHPAWRLSSGTRQGIRAPVFWFRPDHAVMPAFGSFTGGMTIHPDPDEDSLYLVGEDCVIPVPLNSQPKRGARRGVRRSLRRGHQGAREL